VCKLCLSEKKEMEHTERARAGDVNDDTFSSSYVS
jgi:hypothetical protein